MLKTILAAAAIIASAPALAQEPVTLVGVGILWEVFIGYVVPIVGTIAAPLLAYVVQRVFKIRLDKEARDAIETFATNGAGAFLKQFESIAGMQIDAKNPLIATIAREAIRRIPDALERFGWTPEEVAERIADKIGVLTAPAAAAPPAVVIAPEPAPTP